MIMTADLSPFDFPSDPDRTERTLDAAAQVLARRGARSRDIALIAAEVGRVTGTDPDAFRRAFPTRLDIVYAVTLRATHRFVRQQIDGTDASAAPIERISRLIRTHIEFRWEHRLEAELRRELAPALRSFSPSRYRGLSRLLHAYRDHVSAIIAEGRSAGVFTVSAPESAAATLIDTLDGILNWYDPDGGLSLGELGDVYVDLIIHHHLGAVRD